jgi:hypothetical protein
LEFQVNQAIYRDFDYKLERTAKMWDFRSTLLLKNIKFSNPAIEKYQLNYIIRRKLRRTLLLENSQEKEKINSFVRKSLQIHLAIRKDRSTLQLENTKKFNPAIRKH